MHPYRKGTKADAIENSAAKHAEEPGQRSRKGNVEEISADVRNTQNRMRPSGRDSDAWEGMTTQHRNNSQQRCRSMDGEGFKTVLLCPTRTLTPSGKAIKHGTQCSQIFDFKLCAESSDVEQNDADQQRSKRKDQRPHIRRNTRSHRLRQIRHD